MGYEDQMNLYAYVGNDPINMVDPTGKFMNFVIGGVVGAAVEALSQMATNGGSVSDWTRVAAMGAAGVATGGLNIATAGLTGGTKLIAHTANASMDAIAQSGASMVSDSINGNVGDIFDNAGETALNAVTGPGKAVVSAGKGKLSMIGKVTGAKLPKANTGIEAVDKGLNKLGNSAIQTAEGAAGSIINNKLKEENQ